MDIIVKLAFLFFTISGSMNHGPPHSFLATALTMNIAAGGSKTIDSDKNLGGCPDHRLPYRLR